jgi:hypothetical protein
LLNQQTEALYRRDIMENERLEEQIRVQLRLISRCTQGRELALRQTVSKFHLNENVQSNEVVRSFPEYVRPLLEDLMLTDNEPNGGAPQTKQGAQKRDFSLRPPPHFNDRTLGEPPRQLVANYP